LNPQEQEIFLKALDRFPNQHQLYTGLSTKKPPGRVAKTKRVTGNFLLSVCLLQCYKDGTAITFIVIQSINESILTLNA
jgi:hypothetical protein